MSKNTDLQWTYSSGVECSLSPGSMADSRIRYSVLMSVYSKESPFFLRTALESMIDQTVKPEQIVVVKDGPLTPELDEVVTELNRRHPGLFTVVPLPHNRGLGNALAQGMLVCRNEIVARMDSDDYAFPQRMAKELDVMTRLNLDMVGSQIVEFMEDPREPVALSTLPTAPAAIVSYSKQRNPFRHPSMVFRKSKVMDVGNYSAEYLYFEDWDLFNRMLGVGDKAMNVDEPLVAMRVNHSFYARRGGKKYIKYIWKFKVSQLKKGYFTFPQFMKTTIPHIIVCCLPNSLRTFVYTKLLRKGVYR